MFSKFQEFTKYIEREIHFLQHSTNGSWNVSKNSEQLVSIQQTTSPVFCNVLNFLWDGIMFILLRLVYLEVSIKNDSLEATTWLLLELST